MEAILTDVTTVFTSLLDMAGQTVGFITANPLVMLPILIGLAFTGIKVFKAIR